MPMMIDLASPSAAPSPDWVTNAFPASVRGDQDYLKKLLPNKLRISLLLPLPRPLSLQRARRRVRPTISLDQAPACSMYYSGTSNIVILTLSTYNEAVICTTVVGRTDSRQITASGHIFMGALLPQSATPRRHGLRGKPPCWRRRVVVLCPKCRGHPGLS